MIIVNYNVKYFLENTVKSVLDSAKAIATEIIVIDNASADGSEEYIKSRFKDVIYIYNQENVGFAKANNQGLRKAQGDFILVLNPDTLLTPDTLKIMVDYLNSHQNTSLITCKVNLPDGRLDTACHRSFPTAWNSFCHITGLSKAFSKSHFFAGYNLLYLPEDQISEVDAVSGCFMFFRRDILEKGIYLPEDYFMYGEDLDFCYQIKKHGLKIEFVPQTSIIHYRGQSSRKDRVKLRKHFYSSMNIFVKKNYTSRYSLFFQSILDMGIFFAYLLSILSLLLRFLLLPLIDFFSFFIAIFLAYGIYKPTMEFLGLKANLDLVKVADYVCISPIYLALFFFVFVVKRNYTDKKYLFSDFLYSSALIALFSLSITFFLKSYAYSRIMLMLILGIAPALMLFWRYILFKKTNLFQLRTLIVGIDEISQEAVNNVKLLTKMGLYISGFIDVDEKYLGKNIGKHPVFGNIKNIKDVLKLEKIEFVVISSKSLGLARTAELADLLNSKKIHYKILPDFLLIKKGKVQFLEIK